MFKEFKEFIARGNVMDMAVGIIMGAAFTAIVNSMVTDLIMPAVGVLVAGADFSNQFIALDGQSYTSLKDAQDAGAPVMTYGVFINAIINFLLVSIAVFLLVKMVNRIKTAAEKEAENKASEESVEPPADIVLLTEIRDLLKK